MTWRRGRGRGFFSLFALFPFARQAFLVRLKLLVQLDRTCGVRHVSVVPVLQVPPASQAAYGPSVCLD
jgi:hypothetical protein